MSTGHGSGNFTARVRAHFEAIAAHALSDLAAGEELTINVTAEETLFVRFNNNRVRQNTDVEQINVSLCLQSNGRTVEKSRTLSGHLESDQAALTRLLASCRDEALSLPLDPDQVPVVNNGVSIEEFSGVLLAPEDVVPNVVASATGCDLAGLGCPGRTNAPAHRCRGRPGRPGGSGATPRRSGPAS